MKFLISTKEEEKGLYYVETDFGFSAGKYKNSNFHWSFDSRESVGLKWIFRNKHETKDSLKKSDYLMHFKRIDGCLCRIEEVSGHSVASCNSIVNLNEK